MEPSNILKINSLSDNWCDKDIIMLHACFQLLVDCVEKENLLNGHTDWNCNEEYKKAKQEIEELCHWWMKRKIKEGQGRINDLNFEQYHEDTEMLIRLIKIRKFLWT